ncbi:MAG: DUF5658 family protein [Dehalococcoidales bacterium]|jgi:hypothetical protein|nr:DUF5658 family protein [Dehalococcoidales bacterium]
MRNQLAEVLDSAFTFRRCLLEKVAFVTLNLIDLLLTLHASNIGMIELNPLVASILHSPLLLILSKIIVPVFLAWLVPGKWLRPALILIVLVIIWNFKELVLFQLP